LRCEPHDVGTGEEYWVSGVKKRGSNVHWAERISVEIDVDALDEYHNLRSSWGKTTESETDKP
jgi:hypothetical protein